MLKQTLRDEIFWATYVKGNDGNCIKINEAVEAILKYLEIEIDKKPHCVKIKKVK